MCVCQSRRILSHQYWAVTSAQPWRPMRVGCTQSKVSMPADTHTTSHARAKDGVGRCACCRMVEQAHAHTHTQNTHTQNTQNTKSITCTRQRRSGTLCLLLDGGGSTRTHTHTHKTHTHKTQKALHARAKDGVGRCACCRMVEQAHTHMNTHHTHTHACTHAHTHAHTHLV